MADATNFSLALGRMAVTNEDGAKYVKSDEEMDHKHKLHTTNVTIFINQELLAL
jgi:hypothetical protein